MLPLVNVQAAKPAEHLPVNCGFKVKVQRVTGIGVLHLILRPILARTTHYP